MKLGLLLIAFTLCTTPRLFGQNAELKKMVQDDQAARLHPDGQFGSSDEDREKRVFELLAQDAVKTPEDKFNAALILQHTPLDFCGTKLVSKSPDNYLLAHTLAAASYAAGYAPARILVAQTIDRFLSFTKGYQLYGTNRIFNQKTKKEELVPIDRSVPDSERAKYGVPPLSELLKMFPEQERPRKGASSK